MNHAEIKSENEHRAARLAPIYRLENEPRKIISDREYLRSADRLTDMTPTNPKRNEDYKGKNSQILAVAPYNDPRWATFREWISLGRVVAKGQKGTKIARIKGTDRSTGKARFGRGSVFNFEQTVELTPKKAPIADSADAPF